MNFSMAEVFCSPLCAVLRDWVGKEYNTSTGSYETTEDSSHQEG